MPSKGILAPTQNPGRILCHTSGFVPDSYGNAGDQANNGVVSIEDDDSVGDGRDSGEEILIDGA